MSGSSPSPQSTESPACGVIADPGLLPELLPAAAAAGLRVSAIAGIPASATPPDATRYEDTRVLIAQSGVTALLLAGSPREGVELAALAINAGLHLWRLGSLGRNFAEATETISRARAGGRVYRVASTWEPQRDRVRALLGRSEGMRPIYSDLQVAASGPPLASWRSSLVDAGGGVLAQDAYSQLESLVALRGLPESVSAATTRCRRREGEAPRETEDIATAVLRFETGVAVIRATWDIPPWETCTTHHAPEGTICLRRASAVRCGLDGAVQEEAVLPADLLATEMARFVRELRGLVAPEEREAAQERHLAVSALLEAVYLSARNGQPESPRHRYEVQKWPEPRF